jgi:hypothetical protein
MLNLQCTDAEKFVITAAPTDADGAPAAVDGILAVTVVSGDATFVQDANHPLEFILVPGAAGVTSTIKVSGDADLTAGTQLIEDTISLVVTASKKPAVSLGLTAGAAIPK